MEFCEEYSLKNTCRMCSKNNNNLYDILVEHNLVKLLKDFLKTSNFKVEKDDGLPQKICPNCLQKLTSFHEFRASFEKSQKILKEFFHHETDIPRSNEFELLMMSDSKNIENVNVTNKYAENMDHMLLLHQNETLADTPLGIKDENVSGCESSVELRCKICDNLFDEVEQLDKHMKLKHVKRKHDCSFCGKVFQSAGNLKNHVEIHNEENAYTCDICGRGFKRKMYMIRHRKTLHTISHHKCQHCNLEFDNTIKFQYHLKSHETDKKYKCQFCDRSFLQRHHCENHERTHTGERPFLCNICGNDFNCKTNLQLHMKRHNGEKPFKCDECEKGFMMRHKLKFHKKISHGRSAIIKPKLDMSLDAEKRKHECPECGNSFKRYGHLKIHINGVHLKQKPHACKFCGKRFSQSGDRNIHMMCHTGEKPHKCPYCAKCFQLPKTMRSHIMRIHDEINSTSGK